MKCHSSAPDGILVLVILEDDVVWLIIRHTPVFSVLIGRRNPKRIKTWKISHTCPAGQRSSASARWYQGLLSVMKGAGLLRFSRSVCFLGRRIMVAVALRCLSNLMKPA